MPSRFSALREIAWIATVILLMLAGLIWAAVHFAGTAPPTTLVISSASKGSPYHRLAERYGSTFARNNVRLEVRESDGSRTNLEALRQSRSGIDAGFVQGGLASRKDAPELQSLGRVAYEPIWVFHRSAVPLDRLSDLVGKRVLVGPAGGGTNALALQLLEANGVTAGNATLVNRELPDYVDLLARGEADAGFLVLGADARTVQRLLVTPGVQLMSFTNAEAYVQRFPFLSRLDLREGVIDLGRRIPPADTTLLATTAAVLVKPGAHPALVNLLAQAIHETHANPPLDAGSRVSLFQRAGEFPTQVDPEFPMSAEARRVYRSGPPFLQRYLPFWVATTIDRLLVSLVVIVPLLIPLSRIGPQVYRWRVRRRLLYWYGALKQLEADIKAAPTPSDRARKIAELDTIEAAVDQIAVPYGFTDQHYELRQHVDAVRNRITGRLWRVDTGGAGGGSWS